MTHGVLVRNKTSILFPNLHCVSWSTWRHLVVVV